MSPVEAANQCLKISMRIVPEFPPRYRLPGLQTWMVIVGDASVVVSQASYIRKTPDPKPVSKVRGVPRAMVSPLPGVQLVTAAVINVVQEPGLMAGRVMLWVMETYSLIGVPPPMVSDPLAVIPPVAAIFPVMFWLPVNALPTSSRAKLEAGTPFRLAALAASVADVAVRALSAFTPVKAEPLPEKAVAVTAPLTV